MTEAQQPTAPSTPIPQPPQPPPPTVPAVSWQAPVDPAGPAPGILFAGHGARLVAYLIDSLIVSAIVVVLFIVGGIVFAAGFASWAATVQGDEGLSPSIWIVPLILFTLGTILVLLYFPFFWARGGQTPGMRPFGLRVVRDVDGSRIGWGTALLRLVGTWVAATVFYIGYIWIFVDKRRRGWHDLIAGTVVVKQP